MKKLVPLKSIYAFVAVAELGSMTEAANTLSVSHSAISQAIKALENQLNRPLFRRVGRRVELNIDGRRYYKKVAPALEQIVLASEELASSNDDSPLTLNMINSLALHWWIPRVEEFQRSAPNIDIRISNIPMVFDLEREGVDVALIHGHPREWQDYHLEKLGDDNLVLVCSPKLLEVDDELSVAEMLERYAAIYVTNPRRQDDWQHWCDAYQIPIPNRQKNLSFNATIQSVQAAMSGLGVLVTHQQFIKSDIESGLLVQIGNEVLHPEKSFYFACPVEKLKQEKVLTLRSWLHRAFSQ
ncbi:LysR substrate-binding domain-containing protein [Vibrio tapetis]|uniref:Putative glycine cleavage operon activator n=1 Tax=Vibrio tapetis subsp. tapetis TaxID=1671868 RepID=A0A2N8ZEX8_9VIBR|nr:LysR substrate-binding domain-containing protein [Vibrio tapetis]SON50436.1 putative glycine cleavage operon activator [Vibrio tapetis subsp. tapetis]